MTTTHVVTTKKTHQLRWAINPRCPGQIQHHTVRKVYAAKLTPKVRNTRNNQTFG